MTTMDIPARGTFLYWLGNVIAKRGEKAMRARTEARTWVQTTVRLVLHLAGFSCLTVAGFSVSFVAGMITAGVCCFLLSWLFTSSSTENINQRR